MGVQLNIKSAEARALAEKLAAVTGESLTDAVTAALRDRLGRLTRGERSARINAVLTGSRAQWTEAMLRADHGDLLYDRDGLPR